MLILHALATISTAWDWADGWDYPEIWEYDEWEDKLSPCFTAFFDPMDYGETFSGPSTAFDNCCNEVSQAGRSDLNCIEFNKNRSARCWSHVTPLDETLGSDFWASANVLWTECCDDQGTLNSVTNPNCPFLENLAETVWEIVMWVLIALAILAGIALIVCCVLGLCCFKSMKEKRKSKHSEPAQAAPIMVNIPKSSSSSSSSDSPVIVVINE